jgi:hypothetical protein
LGHDAPEETIREGAQVMTKPWAMLVAAVACPLAGCAPDQAIPPPAAVRPEAPAGLLQRAAAATASLTPEQVVAGDPARVAAFCEDLAGPDARARSFGQAKALYDRADLIFAANPPDGGADMYALGEAVRLSCAATFGLDPQELNGLWAWNEFHLGQALFRIGAATQEPALLEAAALASASAANAFQPTDEGWGWSRQVLAQSVAELWRLEGAPPYRAKAVETLQDVARSATPAAGGARAELERLEP